MIVATLAFAGFPSAQVRDGRTAGGISYDVRGSGPPVVLIHGFSLDRRMWTDQVDALESEFQVIRYDLRGHGRSAPPAEPYSAYDDLAAVLDALGLTRATLVGLSAGAQVAIDFAIAYPDRVDRLVLSGPGLSGYVPDDPMTWAAAPFEAAAAGEPERAARLWLETPIMTLHGNPAAAPVVEAIVLDNATLFGYASNPDQPLDPPALGRLGEIDCPVLILVGERDMPHITDVALLLSRGVPGAELVTVPGAGHLLNLDARDQFNERLLAFLSR